MPQTAGDAPILATKLFVPPPREQLVPRARLRDRLAAWRGGRVTLIAAGAGWGKSTLLADWAITAVEHIAWLSLDSGDDEPRRFLHYVVAALRSAEGIASDDLLEALSSRPEAVEAAATELLNAIAVRGAPVSLVLDDYHVIESRAVHDVVQFLIDHLPPNLHLVLATRSDPPLALSRLRARGLLLELRGDDLRFTADEARAFLNGAMGLALDVSEVRELEQRTEGWVVGLQMAAISLSGRDGTGAFIQRFSGSNRYVLDYLTDEVLDRQPAAVRDFLLRTSILTRLTPELCDAVLQRDDSERVLEQLDAANLFLIPLDDVRYWYRYHHLFATLLQHHLARACSAAEVAALHQRAAEWYDAQRMPESALDHALAAKDVPRAVAIVAKHGFARTISGDMASVARWYDRIPREHVDHNIDLLLAQAMSLLGDWQLVRALDCVMRADALLRDDSPPGQRGGVLAIRGTLERTQGKVEEGNAHLVESLQYVDEKTFWYSLAHQQNGLTSMMRADPQGVIDGTLVARSRHARPDQVLVASLAQMFSAIGEWFLGRPDNALAMAHEIAGWLDLVAPFAEGRPLECLPNVVFAEVYCSQDELAKARACADEGVEHGRRGMMLGLFESSRTLAHVATAQRDWEVALRAAADGLRAVRNVGSQFYWLYAADALVVLVRFRRWQATGDRADLQTAAEWLDKSDVFDKQLDWNTRRFCGFYCDIPLLFGARVRIEQGRFDEAQAVLDEVLPHTIETNRVLTQIETLIVRSILEGRCGNVEAAVTAMHTALDLAAKPRYVRLFADEGPSIVPIIERAAARATDRDFAMRVLNAFDLPAAPRVIASAPDALSERELEVLRLVASGATNQEAARKLFIAASTVKKHLENIYAKFGASGRTEAIAMARERALL